MPDTILVFPWNEICFVEFKRPDGKGVLSELQKEEIPLLCYTGAKAYVCESGDHFRQIVKYHATEGKKRLDRLRHDIGAERLKYLQSVPERWLP